MGIFVKPKDIFFQSLSKSLLVFLYQFPSLSNPTNTSSVSKKHDVTLNLSINLNHYLNLLLLFI